MSVSIQSNEEAIHLRHKICRLCLEEEEKLAQLESLYFDNISFLDILKDCIGIEIDTTQNHLPLLICQNCLMTTLSFQTFKSNIFENEVFLQNVNLDELNQNLQASANEINLDRAHNSSTTVTNENDSDYNLKQKQDSSSSLSSNSNYPASESVSSSKSRMKQNETNSNKSNMTISKNQALNHVEEKINFFEGKMLPIRKKKISSSTSESSEYACSICSSFFVNQKQLNNGPCKKCHQAKPRRKFKANTSISQPGKNYVCTACKKKFSKASEWKEHMITHYSMQMYHCMQCNCSFDNRHELIAHTYSHLYLKNERRQNGQSIRRKHCKLENNSFSNVS